MNTFVELGLKLREIREKEGISLTEFADRNGMQKTHLWINETLFRLFMSCVS